MHINDSGWLTLEDSEPKTIGTSSHIVQSLVIGSSPNCSPGLVPANMKFIVAHWTGGSSASSAQSWLSNPQAKASAHFILDRNGQVIQLVPTDKVAWHVGPSEWKTATGNYTQLNRYSIGIEYVNLGGLKKTEGGVFISTTGRTVAPEDVVSHVENGKTTYYHAFPHDQIMAGLSLMSAIKTKFPTVEDIVGHMDIATPAGRKADPGPEFPMAWYKSKLLGRSDDETVV